MSERRANPAVVYLLAVLGLSAFPLVVDWGLGAGDNPWLFQTWLVIGKTLSFVAVAALFYRDVTAEPGTVAWLLRRSFDWSALWKPSCDAERRTQRRAVGLIAVCSLNRLHDGLFAWSTQFVDAAVSAVVHSVWPILFIVLISRDYRHRYTRVSPAKWVLVAAAFAGVSTAITGASGGTGDTVRTWESSLTGALLALAATSIGVLAAKSYTWGTDRARELGKAGNGRLEVLFGMVAQTVSDLLSIPLGLSAAVLAGSGISSKAALAGLGFGAVIGLPAAFMFRKANFDSPSLMVNNLAFFQPLFALGWLALFSNITVGNIRLVLAGATIVLVSNFLSVPAVLPKRQRRGPPQSRPFQPTV
ncbi:MAG: hypothetical protein OXM62_06040 [bacterium]|nr:hypothetical protein [bacterium]MDE0234549.1 hypothetical protein [bacterium]